MHGTDTTARRAELAEGLLARLRALEQARAPWEPVWRELASYILPRKDAFGRTGARGTAQAGPGDERIFDSTACHALETLASALGGLLTNPATPWFDIRVKHPETAQRDDVRAFLAQARERMLELFNSEDTGFQNHVHELYLDVALLGTGVLYVEADPESVVRFQARPMGEVSIGENAQGAVDTVFRRYELTAAQMLGEWGASCSREVREAAETSPEDRVEVVHAVYPRLDRDPFGPGAANFPWASVYLEARTRHVLEESGYLEMPYMAPRWAKASGETYGRGPGLTALSDVRVLNAMSRTALMAAEKMSDPPLMVPDDGFLGPVRSGPGGLSYYRAGTTDRIEALPVAVDLGAAEEMMRQRRESVRRIFLGDQLQEDGPAMTATEAVIRQGERMRVLGPVLGRMQSEFLAPLVGRVFRIMLRAGALPPLPEGVAPRDLKVEYASALSRAQRQTEAQALAQVLDYLGPLAQATPEVLDNFDADRIARHACELFGAPQDYLLPGDDVARERGQRARAQAEARAQAAQGERLEQLARTAKTLSEADVERPSALTELVALFTGGAETGGQAKAKA